MFLRGLTAAGCRFFEFFTKGMTMDIFDKQETSIYWEYWVSGDQRQGAVMPLYPMRILLILSHVHPH
jgi:hypothetical protein